MREEHSRKLVCNIQGGPGSETQVNNVRDGILMVRLHALVVRGG